MEQLGNQETEKFYLKDNSKRAKLIINVFWFICILNLVAVLSGYLELELLQRVKNGEFISEEEANSNDLRQGIIGILQSGLYLTSMILFLNWFRRAYGNLHRMGIRHLEFSETMAVWGFVIPIINLFRPYKIAKEIVVQTQIKLSELASDYRFRTKVLTIGFWWALFLISNYVGRFALKSVFKEETIDAYITSSQAYIFSDFFDILAAIATIIMIKQISSDEEILYEKTNAVSELS